MAKNVLVNLDFAGNEIDNAVIQPLASDPAVGAKIGKIYYNTTDKVLKTYDGTAWKAVGAVVSVNTKTGVVVLTQDDVGDGTTYKRTHNDLTDALVTAINGALQKSGGTMSGAIAMGSNKITGLANGTASTDAAAFGQIPTAGTSSPAMNGTASAGSASTWSKSDHVHPTDTSRMAASLKGAVNGVAELDANGKVPSSQLPSYVDDVIEGYYYNSKFYKESAHTTEITGETGKIYVDLSTDKTYRWGGTAYAEISASLALGETSSTAYRGDRGKTAYDHSQLTSGNPHNVTKANVGLGNVDNKSEATIKSDLTGSIADGDTGFVTGDAAYDALALKAPLASPALTGTPTAPTAATGTNTTQIATTAFVKNAVDAISGTVKTATGTISTSATSASVSFTGTVINAFATMNGSLVICDVAIGSSAVTFTTAAAPSAAVTCTVVYV